MISTGGQTETVRPGSLSNRSDAVFITHKSMILRLTGILVNRYDRYCSIFKVEKRLPVIITQVEITGRNSGDSCFNFYAPVGFGHNLGLFSLGGNAPEFKALGFVDFLV